MAILLPDDLAELRQGAARDQTVNYTKAQINVAMQAIEDWFEANRPALAAAINSATAPYVSRRRLSGAWLRTGVGRSLAAREHKWRPLS